MLRQPRISGWMRPGEPFRFHACLPFSIGPESVISRVLRDIWIHPAPSHRIERIETKCLHVLLRFHSSLSTSSTINSTFSGTVPMHPCGGLSNFCEEPSIKKRIHVQAKRVSSLQQSQCESRTTYMRKRLSFTPAVVRRTYRACPTSCVCQRNTRITDSNWT